MCPSPSRLALWCLLNPHTPFWQLRQQRNTFCGTFLATGNVCFNLQRFCSEFWDPEQIVPRSPDEIRGRTVDDLGGPRSNFESLKWAISSSSHPQAPHLQSFMYDREGREKRMMLACQPFRDESGCVFGCVVTLSEACDRTQPQEQSSYQTSMVNSRLASTAAVDTRCRQCPYIFPRRKARARAAGITPASPRGPSHPVVISLQLLNTLAGMSLHRAADRIGVSATALKKVIVYAFKHGGGAPF